MVTGPVALALLPVPLPVLPELPAEEPLEPEPDVVVDPLEPLVPLEVEPELLEPDPLAEVLEPVPLVVLEEPVDLPEVALAELLEEALGVADGVAEALADAEALGALVALALGAAEDPVVLAPALVLVSGAPVLKPLLMVAVVPAA